MNQTYIRRRIKAEAQINLTGNWLKSFLLAVVRSLFASIIFGFLLLRIPTRDEIISAGQDAAKILQLFIPSEFGIKTIISFAITCVLYILVMSPLQVGVSRFFLGVAKGTNPKIRDVFSVYADLKTVFSSVWLALLVSFISIFWSVASLIIPVCLIIVDEFLGSAVLSALGIILVLIAPFFAFLWNSRYTFALYIFAEGGKGAFESLCECIELLRGRTKECMMLRFSYFFWDIISAYVPPLAFVYFALSGTVYAKYLYYLRRGNSFSDESPRTEI